MKSPSRPWVIPACFFAAAALVNLIARAMGNAPVAAMVKPALLPLIALTSVAAAGSMGSRAIRLLVIAQLLGCAGDIFLIGNGTLPLACGLGCFLAGHIFYFLLFGSISWKGLRVVQWLFILGIKAVAVAALLVAIGVKGAFLVPFAVYGMALMFLISSGMAGILRSVGSPGIWWPVFLGALLFTLSDSLIAVQMFHGAGVLLEFLVMLTYLTAQCLLAWGAVKLSAD